MTLLPPKEVARLSAVERLELISQLWDSLEDQDIAVTPEQRTELKRRLKAIDSESADFVSWDDLRAELRSRQT